MEGLQGPVVDPAAASLHILLVDANLKSRQGIEALLSSCNYQVTACKTGQEAIQVLKAQQGPGGVANFDLILKEHCPSLGTNATRFLRRAQTEPCMQGIPIIVASAVEDRDVMVNCLQLGAADFMLKPLRASELRNLWARVYWWRRATYHQPSALNSNPVSLNESRSGSGSHETLGVSTEPQEAALDEGGSGGASVPTGTTDRGTGDTAPPSKDSKDLLGWSGTKTAVGTAILAQQCSNNPCMPSQDAKVPQSLKAAPPTSIALAQLAKGESLKLSHLSGEIPPLDLGDQSNHPIAKQQATKKAAAGSSPTLGFRAYVATETQPSMKRPLPDLSSREDLGSSGSDWTGSLEKAEQNKRHAAMSAQEQNPSWLSALTQAWIQGHQNQSLTQRLHSAPASAAPVKSQPIDPSHAVGSTDHKLGDQSKPVATQQMPPGFPFCFVPGMMLPPFGMPPAFWSQNNTKSGQPGMLAQFNGQQASGREQGSNQQAQHALHNQMMYHHNLMLQQYGMVPPFMQYSAFANAANQSLPQEATTKATAPVVPVAIGAKRFKSQPPLPSTNSHVLQSGRSDTPTGNLTSTAAHLASASPSNGVQQPLAAAGDSTQETTQTHNNSNNVALDGFMLEPSRKQRRAEALHKYKQKRKNLNFTKKIRYESRKTLAQARPRVKGQFVRITPEEVNAVVASLTPTQMKEVAEGTTDVADLLMETGGGTAEGLDSKAEDLKDVEISDEEGTMTLNGEEDDVNSPATKDCHKAVFSLGNNGSSPQKPALMDKSRRNSSQSGSNSPDTEANHLIEACV